MPEPASRRFSGRAADYARGRPGYPEELYDSLVELAGLAPGDAVADVGAGTGISAEPLLRRGFVVFGVEPEASMRGAAAARLRSHPGFRAVPGDAAATGLEPASVALVLAAQAFHWFDPLPTRREFRRILRPAGAVALVWNARRAEGTAFLAAYERLLIDFGTDYREVGHRGVGAERLASFFGGPYATLRFANSQRLDLATLRARLLSSSYVPPPGAPGHRRMLARLEALHAEHAAGGEVEILYDSELFFGRLAAGA